MHFQREVCRRAEKKCSCQWLTDLVQWDRTPAEDFDRCYFCILGCGSQALSQFVSGVTRLDRMSRLVHVIVVGAGNRGENYARYASVHPELMKVRCFCRQTSLSRYNANKRIISKEVNHFCKGSSLLLIWLTCVMIFRAAVNWINVSTENRLVAGSV